MSDAYNYIPNPDEIPDLYETEDIDAGEKEVKVKLFTPSSSFTWYIVEYDEDRDLAFGYVKSSQCPDGEWGYISLREIRSMTHKVERDIHFKPKKFKNINEF